jgi:hypothetical protein
MFRKMQPRSVYDVMAMIACFIAVAGGTAYAAATIGAGNIKNAAVRSRHIENGAVKNVDLAANSVGSSNVSDGSLLAQDFKPGQLSQGPKGEKGDKGNQGDKGDPGPGAVQFHIHADPNSVSAESPKVAGLSARVLCTTPSGPTKVRVQLLSSTGQLDASGSKAQDGALVGSTALTVGYVEAVGETSAGGDLIARQLPAGKWTSFQLGSYDRGAQGCDLWGVITPAS